MQRGAAEAEELCRRLYGLQLLCQRTSDLIGWGFNVLLRPPTFFQKVCPPATDTHPKCRVSRRRLRA